MIRLDFLYNIPTWLLWIAGVYLVSFIVVTAVRRRIVNSHVYSWATVVGNIFIAMGGPAAIIGCVIALFVYHADDSIEWKTKPPTWL